jgi:hypothetical protein
VQSLIIPFAFLIYSHCHAVLDLLESSRVGEDGLSGLEVLFNTWCENAATFQGFLADTDQRARAMYVPSLQAVALLFWPQQ